LVRKNNPLVMEKYVKRVYIGHYHHIYEYGEIIEFVSNDGCFYYKTYGDFIFMNNGVRVKDCISLEEWRDLRINYILNI